MKTFAPAVAAAIALVVSLVPGREVRACMRPEASGRDLEVAWPRQRQRRLHATAALLALAVAVILSASPAQAAGSDAVCNSGASTFSTYVQVYGIPHGSTVYRFQCSNEKGTVTPLSFKPITGDCYSVWGYRYPKGQIHQWNGTGHFYLTCYIT